MSPTLYIKILFCYNYDNNMIHIFSCTKMTIRNTGKPNCLRVEHKKARHRELVTYTFQRSSKHLHARQFNNKFEV